MWFHRDLVFRGVLHLAIAEGPVLAGHVDEADEDVLNTNTRLRGDTFGNCLVEGLFHLNRTTSVPSDLNKDNAGCVGNPQVAFRWVHKLVVGVTIDNLKLVVRRDVGDVNHGVVNHFAHGANGFSRGGLGEINSNERHCCLSMKLGSYAVKNSERREEYGAVYDRASA